MGAFEANPDGENSKTIKVTGSANYLEWNAFNPSVEAEQKGHYLAIHVELPQNGWNGAKLTIPGDGTTKDVTGFTENDKTADIFMHVNNDSTTKTFTITYTLGEQSENYTVDWRGVVLLPKPVQNDDGTTTTSQVDTNDPTKVVTTTTDSDSAMVGSVALPADTNDLGKMTVEVKAIASIPNNITIQAGEEVKTALGESSTKLVQVTVKLTDAGGDEVEQFASADQYLQSAGIAITIGGLTGSKTYYVFSIGSDGKVTSYGYKTLGSGESTITVNSKHLTIFGAALVDTEEAGNGLTVNDVASDTQVSRADESTSGLTTSSGVTPSGITATWDTDKKTGASDGTVTISGLTDSAAYILKVSRGSDSNVVNVYMTVTASADGKLEVPCQADAVLSLLAVSDASDVWTNTTQANQLTAAGA